MAHPAVGAAGLIVGSALAIAFFAHLRAAGAALDRVRASLSVLAEGDCQTHSGPPRGGGRGGIAAHRLDELTALLRDRMRRLEKLAEERSNAEKRFRKLFEHMTEGVAIHEIIRDVDGVPVDCRFLEANAAFAGVTGLPRAQILGRAAGEVVPELAKACMEGCSRTALTGQAFTTDWRSATLDKDLRVASVPLDDGAFATLLYDVSNQKRSEGQLQRLLRWMDILGTVVRSIAQRSSADDILGMVLRHLEENLPVDFGGVALHSEDSREARMAAVSPGASEVIRRTGFEEQAMLQPAETELFGQLPCDRVALLSLPEALDTGEDRQRLRVLAGFEAAGVRSLILVPVALDTGRIGTIILAAAQPLNLSEYEKKVLKTLTGVVALALDNRKLYQTLERSYERLKQVQRSALDQERLKAMGQMASGVAHDISNALSPISLYSDALLRTEPLLSPQAKEFLRTIREAARDIESKTSRLRQFYRKSDDQEKRQEIDVPDLMRQVTEFTRPRWQHEPQREGVVIRILTEIDPKTPPLVAVESEVREALVNLVLNAADAMPAGGTVALKAHGVDGACMLEVTDSGAGMDEPARRRCLEPFFTTKGESGTGMGLAVVYGTMKRHGGDIAVESSPGRGTTVRLSFPAAVPAARRKPRLRSPGTGSSLRLLCVDDDAAVLNALTNLLHLAGHKTTGAKSGQEALRLLGEASKNGRGFDVVITDLGMPHMDGRQVARRVKEIRRSTPVILLSGWGIQAEEDDGAPECVDRVLSKPPRMDELRQVIEELHERSQRAAQSG